MAELIRKQYPLSSVARSRSPLQWHNTHTGAIVLLDAGRLPITRGRPIDIPLLQCSGVIRRLMCEGYKSWHEIWREEVPFIIHRLCGSNWMRVFHYVIEERRGILRFLCLFYVLQWHVHGVLLWKDLEIYIYLERLASLAVSPFSFGYEVTRYNPCCSQNWKVGTDFLQ